MEELSQDFPTGLDYEIVYNPTPFIRESINEVHARPPRGDRSWSCSSCSLFLQSWRARSSRSSAIPVSLIGTFAVMAALGFSLNNLSLFGLVLAIGIVVDDAIVVVENVERHLEQGLSPREATHRAMDEVAGADHRHRAGAVRGVRPSAFITGITGQFFRQFALTIAASTVISLLQLADAVSPALCARCCSSRTTMRRMRNPAH